MQLATLPCSTHIPCPEHVTPSHPDVTVLPPLPPVAVVPPPVEDVDPAAAPVPASPAPAPPAPPAPMVPELHAVTERERASAAQATIVQRSRVARFDMVLLGLSKSREGAML